MWGTCGPGSGVDWWCNHFKPLRGHPKGLKILKNEKVEIPVKKYKGIIIIIVDYNILEDVEFNINDGLINVGFNKIQKVGFLSRNNSKQSFYSKMMVYIEMRKTKLIRIFFQQTSLSHRTTIANEFEVIKTIWTPFKFKNTIEYSYKTI